MTALGQYVLPTISAFSGKAALLYSCMRFKRYLIIVLLSIVAAGCAHDRQFFSDCRASVPRVRDYAVEHLTDLSPADSHSIMTTAPQLSQANYTQVFFSWSNICTVVSGPPPCEPFKVIDWRKK
jgi:hypothetical protein